MSLAEVHTRAAQFQSRIRLRNLTEYAAAAFVIVAFGWIGWIIPDPMVRAGALLVVAGTLYVCWKLYQLARAASGADQAAAYDLRTFHRAELTRQRAALASVWRWYLAPFAPGALVFLAGVSFSPANPAPLAAKATVFVLGLAFVSVIFAAVAWLNARAVKQLDAELAALDRG